MAETVGMIGARGGNRTHTHLRETDFKSVASTSSATRAVPLKELEAANGVEKCPESASLCHCQVTRPATYPGNYPNFSVCRNGLAQCTSSAATLIEFSAV